MDPLRRLVAILCAGLMLAAVIWAGRYSSWAMRSDARVKADEEPGWQEQKRILQRYADDLKARQQREAMRGDDEDPRPKIADKPPYPKVAVDETVFDFGNICVNETRTHKFKIRNVGKAPLIIYRVPHSAK